MTIAVQETRNSSRWIRRVLFFGVCLISIFFAGKMFFESKRQNDLRVARAAGEVTGSISNAAMQFGPSGLPLPRFVSLKSAKVNVRRGPSSEHAVAWVYQRKGLPIEITAEFENWRRIRDSDGKEGWILQQMLSGKRNIVVIPGQDKISLRLFEQADPESPAVAQLADGVIGEIEACDGVWCEVSAGGYEGFVEQSRVWGAYPGERVN